MDNEKIGKLIAELRKRKGLTQQELGDMVGVGFRAVSKWECGKTLPDIAIINQLSKILGISADELLSGEINEDNHLREKKKIPLGIKILIGLVLSIIAVLIFIFIYYNNKAYVYNMVSANDEEYFLEGQVTFKGDEISIIVNELMFMDDNFNSLKIKNYEYEIFSDNNFLFGYGYIEKGNVFEEIMTIENFTDNFGVNFSGKTDIDRKEILKNNILIIYKFLDINDNEIVNEIEVLLYTQKEKK